VYDEATQTGYVAGSSSLEITGDSSGLSSFINGAYEFKVFDGQFVAFNKDGPSQFGIFIDMPPQRTGSITQNDMGLAFFNPFNITGELLASTATTTTTTDTPEPSTWAMMLIGFVGLGYIGYRRSARLA
jgi:hypothetical protein